MISTHVVWAHHPTKAVARYEGGGLAASVHPNTATYTAPFTVEVYDPSGKCVDRRGAASVEDGVGMARAVLAGVPARLAGHR